MAFEFTVRGHSADPHNLKVKEIFEQTVRALRQEIDSSGSVNGFGYSTDSSGTLAFDASTIEDPVETQPTTDEVDTTDDNINASDAAVSRAKELGVDLTTVTGTGKGGAIKVSDVEAAAKASA